MSKRKLYKNFNKRKKFNGTRVLTVTICLCIVGTYTYVNLKEKDFVDKLGKVNVVGTIKKASIWDGLRNLLDKSNVITSSNIESELDEIQSDNEEQKEESSQVATVNEVVFYTIQVASLEDEGDLKKIKEVMDEYKIPSASMKVDNAQKIQVYSSFDENQVRDSLEDTRTYFSDAFLTKINVPMLSLEYTGSYSYMKDIAEDLNKLIENYQSEAKYWDSDENNLANYKEILTSRQTILENLKKNTEKINYAKMDKFKNNLISYIDKCEDNILNASKNANENKGYISKGLLLSSVQQYYLFVQSLK